MLLPGIVLVVLGFAVSLLSLGTAANVGVRLAMVLAGIAMSLFGIIRVLNGYFLARAIWRK